MNADILLKHFDRISEAPDAIPRLRKFILDLAVRGKLVEQDPNDEPASELLKRIQAEKARLVKEGKASKEKSLPRVTATDISFPPPSGWHWVRLGQICSKTGSGSTPRGGKDAYLSKGIPFLRSQNVYDDGLRLNDVAYISSEIHENMKGTAVLPGDLLLNITGGSIGRCARVSDEFSGANISQHISIVRLVFVELNAFSHVTILSPYFQNEIIRSQTGAGREGLPKNRMDEIEIPLPPLAEQQRIVAKVDELMALCDQLEAARNEREARRDRLVASSLNRISTSTAKEAKDAARFHLDQLPSLTTRIEHIKQLRQAILNLAVYGQLVPQDPNDEPAAELLKRIQAEKARLVKEGKIRKQQPLPRIETNELSYCLPLGWAWTRLGEISQLVTSGSRDWAKYYSKDGAIFVRMGNLSKDNYRMRLAQIQHVTPPINGEGGRTRLEPWDILISITGDVGMLGLVPEGFGEAYINQHTAMVRPMDEVKGLFLAELFRSPFAQNQFNAPQRGIKNSFRLTDVTELIIPLPPLAEQHRIVAKVDELMALCDQLEAQLTTTETDSRRLLEAVLRDALQPALEAAV